MLHCSDYAVAPSEDVLCLFAVVMSFCGVFWSSCGCLGFVCSIFVSLVTLNYLLCSSFAYNIVCVGAHCAPLRYCFCLWFLYHLFAAVVCLFMVVVVTLGSFCFCIFSACPCCPFASCRVLCLVLVFLRLFVVIL